MEPVNILLWIGKDHNAPTFSEDLQEVGDCRERKRYFLHWCSYYQMFMPLLTNPSPRLLQARLVKHSEVLSLSLILRQSVQSVAKHGDNRAQVMTPLSHS